MEVDGQKDNRGAPLLIIIYVYKSWIVFRGLAYEKYKIMV